MNEYQKIIDKRNENQESDGCFLFTTVCLFKAEIISLCVCLCVQ